MWWMPVVVGIISIVAILAIIVLVLLFINKLNKKASICSLIVLLLILGILLPILICYQSYGVTYLEEGVKTFLWFFIPVLVLTIILIPIRIFVKIPDFIYRKILHITAIGMTSVLVIIPTHWWISEIVLLICSLGIIFVLIIFETTKFYKELFIEKGNHEVLISITLFFLVIASLIAFFFGFRGDNNKYYVIIALAAWGLGDAFASIIGHLIGKHKVSGKFIEGVKSIEGTIAGFIFSFIISFILLIVLMHSIWWLAVLESLVIGIAVSLVELFTKKGLDNITCPIAAAIILFLFSLF